MSLEGQSLSKIASTSILLVAKCSLSLLGLESYPIYIGKFNPQKPNNPCNRLFPDDEDEITSRSNILNLPIEQDIQVNR